jgi:DmsE family decaheme c-type cytochrome
VAADAGFQLTREIEAVFFMHSTRPVSQLSIGAAPRKREGLRVLLLLLLAAGLLCVTALAAPPPGAKSSNAQANQAVQGTHAEFVGADTCASCHEEVSKGFAANPHTKLAQLHGNNGVTCESCHGPGSEHVSGGGDVTKIFNPAKAPTKEVNAKCLSCHGAAHPNFARSPHGEANVGCISCHSVHHSEDTEHLLKAAQPALCFQCHTDVKPQFSMPFHHRVEEGLILCNDCHDPHGTLNPKSVKSASEENAVCAKCHSETAGPWMYEHAVVKTEGCTACHFPHGGPNPRLLNRANVNTVCLQCHSPSMNFTSGTPQGPAHNQATQYQSCTTCHTSIHGSNVSPIFFNSN